MIGLHEIPKEQTLGMFFIRSTGQCSIGECYESRTTIVVQGRFLKLVTPFIVSIVPRSQVLIT
jgi:hypothetical protein